MPMGEPKVYVVYDLGNDEVLGAFSSKEKAENFRDNYDPGNPDYRVDYLIDELDIDYPNRQHYHDPY
jgi:hypothetical protein